MLVPVSAVFSLKNVFCLTDAKTCKCWHPHSRGRCRGRDELTGWWCNTFWWWWSSLNDFLCVFEGKCVSLFFLFPLQQRNTSECCTGRVLNDPLWFECICTKDWCVTWPVNHCGQRDLIRFGSHVKVFWSKEKQTQIIKRILKCEQQTFTGSWKLQKTSADGRKVRTYKSSPQTCVLFWRCVPLHACRVVLAQDWLLVWSLSSFI